MKKLLGIYGIVILASLSLSAPADAATCALDDVDERYEIDAVWYQSGEDQINAVVTCLLSRIRELEAAIQSESTELPSAVFPSNAVVAFAMERPENIVPGSTSDDPCPGGWTRYTEADGRFIVGVGRHVENDPLGFELDQIEPFTEDGHRQHRLSKAELAVHRHGSDGNTVFWWYNSDRNGTHSVPLISSVHDADNAWVQIDASSNVTSASEGGQPHNNMPPYIALYFCKKD